MPVAAVLLPWQAGACLVAVGSGKEEEGFRSLGEGKGLPDIVVDIIMVLSRGI